jgi:DNA topoisomerase VI subunit A
MVNGLAARTQEVLGKPGLLLEFPGGIGSLVEELGKHPDTVAARINMGGVSVYDERPDIFVDLSQTKTDRHSTIQKARRLAEQVATHQFCQNNIVRHTVSELRNQWGAVPVHQKKQSRRQNLVALLGDIVTKPQLLTHSLTQLAR